MGPLTRPLTRPGGAFRIDPRLPPDPAPLHEMSRRPAVLAVCGVAAAGAAWLLAAAPDPPPALSRYPSLPVEDQMILGDLHVGSVEDAKRYVKYRKGVTLPLIDVSDRPDEEFDEPPPVPFHVYDGRPDEDGAVGQDDDPPRGDMHQLRVEQRVMLAHADRREDFQTIADDHEARLDALRDAGYELRGDPTWWHVDIEQATEGPDGTIVLFVRAFGDCVVEPEPGFEELWFDGDLEEVWAVGGGRTGPELVGRTILFGSGAPEDGDGAGDGEAAGG